MSLFDICCPKKPKRSLDYVIKWVEEADKTLKELTEWKSAIDSDIESLVKEAVEGYDWSDLPQEALDHKADKVISSTYGNFASLDAGGNLQDSGKKPTDFVSKEEYAGVDMFQDSDAINTILSEGVYSISYKQDGKKYPTQHILVVTRGYGKTKPTAPTREIVYQLLIDDFGGMMKRYRKFTDAELLEPDGDWTEWTSMIPAVNSVIMENGEYPVTGAAIYSALAGKANLEHYHNIITNQISEGKLAEFKVDATSGTATIGLNDGTTYKSSEININNIDNLNRVLQGPQVPTQGSNKYSTSGQIYDFVKTMSPKELTLVYGTKVINKWELLSVSDNQEFFNRIPYNTPVSIKFRCQRQAGQSSDVLQHDFYVYGSLQINFEGQEDEKAVYIYINNAVYQGSIARLDGQDWIYPNTITLTKLQEDPFF